MNKNIQTHALTNGYGVYSIFTVDNEFVDQEIAYSSTGAVLKFIENKKPQPNNYWAEKLLSLEEASENKTKFCTNCGYMDTEGAGDCPNCGESY